jgi:hypothetical protein
MTGFLIEGAQGNVNNAFNFNVVLIALSVDEDLWRTQKYDMDKSDAESQIDNYPVRSGTEERYKEQLRNQPIFVPQNIILASPGFCRNSGSGGEPECLHSIGVLSFDDEFREAVAWGGIREKFRHAVAQGIGDETVQNLGGPAASHSRGRLQPNVTTGVILTY